MEKGTHRTYPQGLEPADHEYDEKERLLAESEARYKTLFEYNPIQTIVVDHDGKIEAFNMAKKVSQDRLPAIGDVMFRDYASRYPQNMHTEMIDCMRSGRLKRFDSLRYGDKFLSVTMAPFPGGAIITAIDVTEQRRAEMNIQRLTRQVLDSAEVERRRISWMLHDELAQELSSIKLGLDALLMEGPGDPVALRKTVSNLSKTLQDSIKAVRDLSYELHPQILDGLGIVQAIRSYCGEFEEDYPCCVHFDTIGMDRLRLDFAIEIVIYRILVEGLRNIRKHSGADRVAVKLSAIFPNIIKLVIEDNGRGFEPENSRVGGARGEHMGLNIIRQRVSLIDGEMKIISKPGRGTSLRIKIPVKETPHG